MSGDEERSGTLHAAFVAFVVLGLLSILVGGALGWRWVRDPRFRAAHLAAIALVVAESWAGVTCPLTSLEDSLRESAGEATYSGAFVAHWLGRLLYWQAPPWAFTLAYTLFGSAVAAGWIDRDSASRLGITPQMIEDMGIDVTDIEAAAPTRRLIELEPVISG